MKKIKEVIVVEGKDDTKRIQRAVDADTIETRGSAIPEETLMLIKKLAKTRGVIVFTDPDFSGEKKFEKRLQLRSLMLSTHSLPRSRGFLIVRRDL